MKNQRMGSNRAWIISALPLMCMLAIKLLEMFGSVIGKVLPTTWMPSEDNGLTIMVLVWLGSVLTGSAMLLWHLVQRIAYKIPLTHPLTLLSMALAFLDVAIPVSITLLIYYALSHMNLFT